MVPKQEKSAGITSVLGTHNRRIFVKR